jgi:hypothetical protein
MAKQTINIGTAPNDGTGTPLRTSFDYCNLNFTELYTAVGPSGNNIVVPGSATISGDLTAGGDAYLNGNEKYVYLFSNYSIGNNSRVRFRAVGAGGGSGYGGDFRISTRATNNTWNTDVLTIDSSANCIWTDGAGGTRMTLNSTGLGVGKSPTYKLDVLRSGDGITAGFAGGTYGIRFDCGGGFSSTGSTIFGVDPTLTGTYQPLGISGSLLTFGISGVEKARLDASGNLLVGAASFAVNNGKLRIEHSGLAGEWGFQTKSSTTDGYVGVFYTTTGQAGFISVNGTSTTFSTTSDYRLKESVQPLIGGLARINNLKPSTYKWKADGSNSEGFIAHELAEVVPAAVTGQKDAVNADGSIKPQGVDLSKLVPILVAAIQELTARVQTLEAK